MSDFDLLPLIQASGQTLYMVFIASFIGIFLGLLAGIFLFLTQKDHPLEKLVFYRVFGLIINVGRSIPFVILLISIIPFTRFIVGSAIGINAAIVPLALTAIPFFARVVESALALVPMNLIETGNALGASTAQIVWKILLPEAQPALVRGAALTVIALIGYSAMAGVVGGGGLGELAINYGYQQFNLIVILETVVLLVILVQFIQTLGDFLASKRLKIGWVLLISVLCWGICIMSQARFLTASRLPTIRVGIISGPQEKIMKTAQKVAKHHYHFRIKLIVFTDYQLPNQALDNGEIDANIFQHLPFLNTQIQQHQYNILPIAKTFLYPFGFYSKKISRLSQLQHHALIAIPNDATNQARALLLLQQGGFIKLSNKKDPFRLTPYDIVKNFLQLKITPLNAAQLPRVLQDAELIGLTNDYVTAAGFKLSDALLKENSASPYANLIVIRKGDNNPLLKKLVIVMHSKPVIQANYAAFTQEGAIQSW
jgi:YaeC family lipoprotein